MRDVDLVGGAMYRRATNLGSHSQSSSWSEFLNLDGIPPQKVEPLMTSKVNTCLQLALVTCALLKPEFGTPQTQSYITYVSWLVASTTVTSTAAYGTQYFKIRSAFIQKSCLIEMHFPDIGIGDQTPIEHDNDEPDDGAIPIHNDDNIKKRSVPTRAALSIIKPSIRRSTVSERAKIAMQNYLNHFLGNIDIVNSREVCKFLEVSNLSFSPEYGPSGAHMQLQENMKRRLDYACLIHSFKTYDIC